jgi:translation initiation factor 1
MAVKIYLDTAKRRGKTVTIIENIPHNPQVIKDWCTDLKKQCGSGGTTYQKTIEIQGDHRKKAEEYVKKQGLDAKMG